MAPNMYRCTICSFSSLKFSRLVSHIGSAHRYSKTSFVCGVSGCCRRYSVFHIFRKHLYRFHCGDLDLENRQEANLDPSDDIIPTLRSQHTENQPCVTTSSDTDTRQAASVREGSSDELQDKLPRDTGGSVHDFYAHSKKQLSLLFFTLSEIHRLPLSTTELIFDEFKSTIRDILENFAIQVTQTCEMSSDARNRLNSILESNFVEELFECTSTNHQRQKFAKENFPYVHPQECTLSQTETFQYIPIKGVLENLLTSESFRSHLNDYASHKKPAQLSSFQDGLLYARKAADLIQDGSQFTLFLILYSDELEIANPLGSKRGTYKLFVVYFSVVNVHARYRSQLRSIHVAIIAKYAIVQKRGLSPIMKPLFNELSILKETGFTVKHLNSHVKVTAVVIAFCGDNLSMNKMGGFICSFSRGRPCRFCTTPMEHMETICHENDCDIRTQEIHRRHQEDARENLLSFRQHGVKEVSPLLDLKYLDITLQLPPDLMHDILEGIIPHVLREVLNGMITENVLSYPDLDKVAAFDYGPHAKHNKPEPLTRGYVQGKTGYKGTASQKWCLFYLFSVIFGDSVPEGNLHWEVFLMLRNIVDLVFAEQLPRDHVPYLQDEIRCFLTKFVARYPGKMIPKLHFLIHYPRIISELGPLKQYWCMRYEAKHQYFKTMASRNKNFKNICKSLANRHQLLQSFETAGLDLETVLETTKPKRVSEGDLPVCALGKFSSDIPVWDAASAKLDHCLYKIQDVILLHKGDFPSFGQILNLLVHCGSLFIVVNMLETVDFNRHQWSYVVRKTATQKLVLPTDIACHDVHDLYFGSVVVPKPGIMIDEGD